MSRIRDPLDWTDHSIILICAEQARRILDNIGNVFRVSSIPLNCRVKATDWQCAFCNVSRRTLLTQVQGLRTDDHILHYHVGRNLHCAVLPIAASPVREQRRAVSIGSCAGELAVLSEVLSSS